MDGKEKRMLWMAAFVSPMMILLVAGLVVWVVMGKIIPAVSSAMCLPEKTTFIGGKPYLCTPTTELEVRCYPTPPCP